MDVIITYETLFDILRKEKSREELQELTDDFYLQAFAFIKNKTKKANRNFFEREQIQLRNTKKILKELFERRERKIINLAIDSARTESMIINKEAMTPKEKIFFEEALNFVKLHKMKIIGPALTGIMPENLPEYNDPNKKQEIHKEEIQEEKNEDKKEIEIKTENKLKVIITMALPKFLGPDGKVLGPFNEGQEAILPEKVALILEKKGKAKLI